jgi:hypothetical protein
VAGRGKSVLLALLIRQNSKTPLLIGCSKHDSPSVLCTIMLGHPSFLGLRE